MKSDPRSRVQVLIERLERHSGLKTRPRDSFHYAGRIYASRGLTYRDRKLTIIRSFLQADNL